MRVWGTIDDFDFAFDDGEEEMGIAFKKSADSDESSSFRTSDSDEIGGTESQDLGENGAPMIHEGNPDPKPNEAQRQERDFRKKLNQEAREAVSQSLHKGVKLIVHRPEFTPEQKQEYSVISQELMPIVREIARKTLPLLEHDEAAEFARNHLYGTKFQVESVAYRDYRYFAKKRPPTDSPSLVVGLRIDESASMSAFGRLAAAKRAAVAVYEFCQLCRIPVLIYGDTADASRLEQMSIYAYTDYEKADPNDRFKLMGLRPRSNNRDGMVLRIMAQRLAASPQRTKLLISMSDGQPKAMDDYTGSTAAQDMHETIAEYERKGVTWLAAAIGQDKEVISQLYGKERFLDMTNLHELPGKLVRIISRYL